jgi:hypothetical protein
MFRPLSRRAGRVKRRLDRLFDLVQTLSRRRFVLAIDLAEQLLDALRRPFLAPRNRTRVASSEVGSAAWLNALSAVPTKRFEL